MQNEKNDLMILEINPRPSGSFVVAEVGLSNNRKYDKNLQEC